MNRKLNLIYTNIGEENMLIIVGSRREGNCYNLANKVKEELDKERISSKIIVPGNQRIHICTGCMDCDKDGVCDFTDDMLKNIETIRKEDTLMFITPIRWNLLSGDLKIFIDRLNPLYARKELKGKKMIAVSIGCKGKEVYSTEVALNDLLSFAENSGMNVILTKQFNHCLKENDILEKCEELNQFIEDIKSKIA